MSAPGATAQSVVYFVFSALIGCVLFRENRQNINPLKWPKADLALLLISLFFFLGGWVTLYSADILPSARQHLITGLSRRSVHSILSASGYWVLLLAFTLWLKREPPRHKNPLEWGTVDRTLLLVWIFFLVGGIQWLEENLYSSVVRASWINQNFGAALRPVYAGEATFVLVLLLTGLWLRRRRPENQVFAHIVIQYAAMSSAFNAYLFGALTNPNAFLAGMALGASTLLLFRPGIALPAVGTFMVMTVGGAILSGAGLLPYAPMYAAFPVEDGRIAATYLISSLTWTTIVFVIVLSLMTFVLVRWRNRERKLAEMTDLLRKMFGRYLSTEVMNALIEDPASMELGGERRQVTIMMTDLRGFTALSERLEPEQVVQMLNTYFEVMVDIVLEFNGTINEIIGDALLVVFGAPHDIKDRAEKAVACAISMQNAMKEVNAQNREQGLPEIEMGIGLNESEVIVGNIGSRKRSKYAVVGSGVNMASRIESYTVGGQVLISESVKRQASDILRIDAQLDVTPKGAEGPIRIYEVGGIGGSYDVAMETADPLPVPLAQPIPLLFTLLEGKKVDRQRTGCTLLALSGKGALMRMPRSLEPMTNLRLNLQGVPKKLSTRDFYGKVIDWHGTKASECRIRFTAIPAEVDAYFEALLRYGTKPPQKGSGKV